MTVRKRPGPRETAPGPSEPADVHLLAGLFNVTSADGLFKAFNGAGCITRASLKRWQHPSRAPETLTAEDRKWSETAEASSVAVVMECRHILLPPELRARAECKATFPGPNPQSEYSDIIDPY